jgi:alkaline phosphatase
LKKKEDTMSKNRTKHNTAGPGRWPFIAALTAIAVGAFSLAAAAGPQPWKLKRAQAKNIILFIGDGMQLEHEIATSLYLTGKPQKLAWHNFLFHRAPCTTWDVTTYNRYADAAFQPRYSPASFDPRLGYDPARGGRWPFPIGRNIDDLYFLTRLGGKYPATDSASAATAWATGYKTDDGNLAWLPGDIPGGSLRTIAEDMRDMLGSAIGVVSTVPYSHATPAAHVSHNVSRNNYHAIADEIIRALKPDVVIGGGHPSWNGAYMSMALYSDVKTGVFEDYVFVERVAGQNGGEALMNGAAKAAAKGKKLFGLFGGSGGNFEPPLPQHSPGAPAIVRQTVENPLFKEAVISTLKVLSKDPDGFFAMFEQGDIDWANHANDYRWMVGTTWDLHEAVKAAIEFVRRPGDDVDWSNTMLIVTADHSNSYMRLVRDENGHPVLGEGMLPNGFPASGGQLGLYDLVTYGSTEHTNELVMLYVHGRGVNEIVKRQGTWYGGTQIIDNTQLYEAMAEAAGIR